MNRSIKFSPEAAIKAVASLARHNDPALALEAAEVSGNAEQAVIIKALYDVAHTTADVQDGASIFDALMPIVKRQSLMGKIAAIYPFYEVPKNIRVLKANDSPAAGFVAESAVAPVYLTDLESTSLQPKAIRAVQILTDELVKTRLTEHLLSRGLIRAAADAESTVFASANAQTAAAPAGLFNGISPASGTADIEADFAALADAFAGDLSRAVLICNPKTAIKLGAVFHGAGLNGDVCGLPIAAHNAVADGVLALIEPGRVMITDDGMTIQPSEHSTVMAKNDDDEDVEVSLWQANLIAFRITRCITWAPAADAVAWVSGGTW